MACNECNECTEQNTDCTCLQKDMSTDCSLYTGDNLECSGITKNTILTTVIKQLDTFICNKFNDVISYLSLTNIGLGAKIYKGISGTGVKELRTISSLNTIVTVNENVDTVDLDIDEGVLTTFIQNTQQVYTMVTKDCPGVPLFEAPTIVGSLTTFNVKGLESDTLNITSELNGCVSIETIPTIENTFLSVGDLGQDVYKGLNGTVHEIRKIKSSTLDVTVDNDSIKIEAVANTDVNLQKTINTFPYVLTDADDTYTIFVDNSATNVVINVPDTLVQGFACVFIQKGTGTVTITETGTAVIFQPSTLQKVIKGTYFWALLEKDQATNDFYLGGSLLLV